MGVALISAVLLLGLVSVISGQRTDVEFIDRNHCLSQACDIDCDFGFKLNTTGCPYCECANDPCEDFECGDDEVCRPQLCRSYPCKQMMAACVKSSGCDETESTRCKPCPFGYRMDANGCHTCQCKTEPCEDKKCLAGQTCIAHMAPCLDNDDTCRALPVCLADKRPVPKGPFACPMMDCVVNEYCRHGYRVDAQGCQTCVCKSSPCEGHSCKEGFRCEARTLSCPKGEQCRVIPVCRVMSLCHHKEALNQVFLLHGAPMTRGGATGAQKHVPECDDNGSFKPKQCDPKTSQCWCVNDWGQEVKGTRAPVNPDERFCDLNHTVAVDISFTVVHGFKDITIHQEGLKRVIQEHISYWLMIEKVHVTVVDVRPNMTLQSQYAVVKVTVVWDSTYDLPSAVENMRRRMGNSKCDFHYNGKLLRPDATSFKAHRHFQQKPRVSICGGYRPMGRAGGLKLMICAIGVISMMFAVFFIVALISRRRRAQAAFKRREMSSLDKMDVSFGNKLYDIVEAPELPKKQSLPE